MLSGLIVFAIFKYLQHKVDVKCVKKSTVTFLGNTMCDFILLRVSRVLKFTTQTLDAYILERHQATDCY